MGVLDRGGFLRQTLRGCILFRGIPEFGNVAAENSIQFICGDAQTADDFVHGGVGIHRCGIGCGTGVVIFPNIGLVFRNDIAGNSTIGVAFVGLLHIRMLRVQDGFVPEGFQILHGIDGFLICSASGGDEFLNHHFLDGDGGTVVTGYGSGIRHIIHRKQGAGVVLAPGVALLFPDILANDQLLFVETHFAVGVRYIALQLEYHTHIVGMMGNQLLSGFVLQTQGFFAVTQIVFDYSKELFRPQGSQCVFTHTSTARFQHLLLQLQRCLIFFGKVQCNGTVVHCTQQYRIAFLHQTLAQKQGGIAEAQSIFLVILGSGIDRCNLKPKHVQKVILFLTGVGFKHIHGGEDLMEITDFHNLQELGK